MTAQLSNLAFNGMSFIFKIRDLMVPRRAILAEVGIKPGDRVLDYGCGPGAYVPDTAEMVGQSGIVYALDLHPLAIERVQRLAQRRGLSNVQTIQSNCRTGLPDNYLDVVLLYDIFHMLDNAQAVLVELHRTLKPDGVLSFNDHHMKEAAIIESMTQAAGGFTLAWREEKTYTFVPKAT